MSATGRNATQLAAQHPIPAFDERLSFTESTHAYFLDGRRFSGPSVTALLKKLFPQEPFNGPLIVQKNLASWRANDAHRYYPLVLGKNDAEATAAILAVWKEANELGTFLHRLAELHLNGVPQATIPDSVAKEYGHLLEWLEDNPHLEPHRTELSVYGKNEKGRVVIVGQADALFRNKKTGEYVLVDFKRVDKDLTPGAPAFGRTGVGIMRGIDANEFFKYSIQAWLYATCIEQSTDLVISDCMLLQLHPSLPTYQYKQCRDFRCHAEMILDGLS